MKPEHRLQSWADRFIDRVVLPPMFTTALDHEARDVRYAATLQARGLKFGLPDALVIQLMMDERRIAWIEYKRGSNKLTARQEGIHKALTSVGTPVYVLHPNAENLCIEYEHRLTASDDKATVKKPSTAARIQRRRPSRSQIASVFGAMKPL
jgi:hypothetical protein